MKSTAVGDTTVAAIATATGLSRVAIHQRIRQGWSAEDLLRPKQQGVPRVKWREKIVQCNQCGNLFSTLVPTQKYCSIACKRTFHRKDGCETTARHYAAISGNWVRYLARLCQRSFRRESLSVDACLRILARQRDAVP